MKTLTKLVNTTLNTEIVIADNLESNADKYRHVVAKGCDLGRTSFMNILTGKAKTAKGWVLEVTEVKPAATKVFGMEFSKDKVQTAAKTGAPRKRRDMDEVVSKARKHKVLGPIIAELESKGFTICDVDKKDRWICANLPSATKTQRTEPRVDISPLKNGKVNFSMYVGNRATGVKRTLEAAEATPANIAKEALHKDFTGTRA